MSINTDELYAELKKKITAAKLKDISIEVIGRYKKKDHMYLVHLAERIGISSADCGINRVFAQIIQLYHPDRLKKIMSDIESFKSADKSEELARLKSIYLIDVKRMQPVKDYTIAGDEEYIYDGDKSGYDEYADFIDEDEDVAEDAEFDDEEDDEFQDDIDYGFIEAVNDLYLGNLEYELSLSDLQNLEGELDLSGFDLEDLTGAEYCTSITSLNLSANRIYRIHQLSALTQLEVLYLSGNRIDDITFIEGLIELRELDLSFNDIEDISVLLELPKLRYVNLVDNPVRDETVIEELQENGVIVIY